MYKWKKNELKVKGKRRMNLHLGSLQKLPIDIDKIIVSILSLFVTPCLHALIIIYVYADWSIISIIMLDIAKSLDYLKQMGNKLTKGNFFHT